MDKTRTVAKWFAGLAVLSTLVIGAVSAPAQANDTGWNPTMMKPANDTGWNPTGTTPTNDTGWNPTP